MLKVEGSDIIDIGEFIPALDSVLIFKLGACAKVRSVPQITTFLLVGGVTL